MLITAPSIPAYAKVSRPTHRAGLIRFGQGPDSGDAFQRQPGPACKITPIRLPLPLDQAATTQQFVAQMAKLIEHSPWVQVNPTRLAEVARSFTEAPKLLDWKGYISDTAFNATPPDLNRAMFELALNIANQSGFITVDSSGQAKKWEIGGSGAAAMVQVIGKIREAAALPGIDITDPAQVPAKLDPLLSGIPFREDRLAIFQEFAQPNAYPAVGKILDQARTGPNSYRFTFESVKALAKAFPKAFGSDPFYKKASLVLLAMAGFGRPRGLDIHLDVPVASDYRLPQTLENLGILKFSPELNDALQQGTSFHEDDDVVQHLRAASVVAAAELSNQTGFDAAAIDGLLWGAARKQSKAQSAGGTFSAPPKPHLMVPTMRF